MAVRVIGENVLDRLENRIAELERENEELEERELEDEGENAVARAILAIERIDMDGGNYWARELAHNKLEKALRKYRK